MTKLKVCFVGIGSIAKRHIRNLQEICDEREIQLSVDAFRHRRIDNNTVIEEFGIHQIITDFSLIGENEYDAVFITNPTNLHYESLLKFKNCAKNIFVEKPICSVSQIKDLEQFTPDSESVYYVACPLRYNAVIQYFTSILPDERVLSVRCISSSYLPDWRPGQDYRNTYSAHREMGGGVSIDLIHEWDYITYLFGFPDKVSSFMGKVSNLEIDSDDYAIYIAQYNDKVVELHLDYFGRVPVRTIEVFTPDDTIVGDLINNTVWYRKTGKQIDFKEQRNDFQKRELQYFIDLLINKKARNDIPHAVIVLKLSQGIL